MFKLSISQEMELDFLKGKPPAEIPPNCMAKWLIQFQDDKQLTMLTNDCHTREEAFIAAVERFGKKVKTILN